jgi:hypothetical protein
MRSATTRANASGQSGVIARTQDHLQYRPGQAGLLLFDHDTKTMPASVAVTIESAGGFWPSLISVVSDLERVGSMVRSSTSAGLYSKDTGEKLPGSGNLHCFVPEFDASGDERALRAIQDRCWLAGLAWYSLGKAGQLIERGIINPTVGTPERLVFEGGPIVRASARARPRRSRASGHPRWRARHTVGMPAVDYPRVG